MRTTVRRTVGIAVVTAGSLAAAISAIAAPPEHVTVCHRTGSPVNPFVEIAPSINGAWAHYTHHPDDAFQPFEYTDRRTGEVTQVTRTISADGLIAYDEGEEACVLVEQEPPEEEEPPEVEPGDPVVNEPPFTG